jgi:anti-sigma regulatory factor (Ser/Thr protein kinase)
LDLEQIKGPVVLEIPADPASLFMVRTLVGEISQRIGFARREVERLVLAIDEACANVIRHAYDYCHDKRIILTFVVSPEYFTVEIRDFGPPADPATFQPRKLDDLRPGGLGIHFIRSAVDKIEFENPPGGGVLLRLVKFRPKRENAQN